MSTQRHRVVLAVSERLAEAAREAEKYEKHGRAAALYWAASMVLQGHSVDEALATLEALHSAPPRG
jgi:hypothetical protein